jgi:hypothetical protein
LEKFSGLKIIHRAKVSVRIRCEETSLLGNCLKKSISIALISENLFSSLSFIADKMEDFEIISERCSINMRYKHDLHVSNAKLKIYQTDVHYAENTL